jgi:hypothetical protein
MTVITAHLHRERTETHELIFGRNNLAAERETADRCELMAWHPRGGVVNLGRYDWPQQQQQIEQICDALDAAFQLGKCARSAELRKLLDQ